VEVELSIEFAGAGGGCGESVKLDGEGENAGAVGLNFLSFCDWDGSGGEVRVGGIEGALPPQSSSLSMSAARA
jgi:hypothetical protein